MIARARPRLLFAPLVFAMGWLVACGGDSPLAAVPTETPAVSTPIPVVQPTQPPASPEPAEVDGVREYIVVSGDTLGGIAEQFGVTVDQIVAANGLDDPDTIFPGQTLTIPEAEGGES